jgi:hypothetical protein
LEDLAAIYNSCRELEGKANDFPGIAKPSLAVADWRSLMLSSLFG